MRSDSSRGSDHEARAKRRDGQGQSEGQSKAKLAPRKAAQANCQALDNALRHGVKRSLSEFMPMPEESCDKRLHQRPLLCLHFDEASPNLSMAQWLVSSLKARVCWLRDPFHREWNDCSLALKAAGLWSNVLVTSLLHNLPYGPWDGSAWFHRLCDGAAHMCHNGSIRSELFTRLWPAICRDSSMSPIQSDEQQQLWLSDLTSADAFLRKGKRTALKRWFSWLGAAQEFDRQWHTILLVILHIGMHTGIYRSAADTPLWGDTEDPGELPSGADSDDEEDAEAGAERAEANVVVQRAEATARRDTVTASRGDQSTEDKAMKRGDEHLKDLRKKCKNTLFVAAALLSDPDLQAQYRMIYVMCGPLCDTHSEHAASVRNVQDTIEYYQDQSLQAYCCPHRADVVVSE